MFRSADFADSAVQKFVSIFVLAFRRRGTHIFFDKPAGSLKNHVFLKVCPPRAINKTGRQKKSAFRRRGATFFLNYRFCVFPTRPSMSTARVSSRKYFIPGCVGRGLDLDLRIRPAPAASGWAQAGPDQGLHLNRLLAPLKLSDW